MLAISLNSEKKCILLYPVFLEGPEGKSTFRWRMHLSSPACVLPPCTSGCITAVPVSHAGFVCDCLFVFKSLWCPTEPAELIQATERERKNSSEASIYWGHRRSPSSELCLHRRVSAVSPCASLFLRSYSHPQAAAAIAETLTQRETEDQHKVSDFKIF